MISPVACLLYTQDPDLVRRTRAFLRNRASVRHLDGPERLEAVLQQNSPALLVLDLRCHETHDLLEQVKAEWPDVLIVALGVPRSEPLRDAEQAGIYAAEDVDLERRPFQALIGSCLSLQTGDALSAKQAHSFADCLPCLARGSPGTGVSVPSDSSRPATVRVRSAYGGG